MDSKTVMKAAYRRLTDLTEAYLEALDGIPDEDLAHWRPAASGAGGGEMNTFSGMSMHAATVARYIWEHQVFGQESPRDRIQEWNATITMADITELFNNMLRRIGDLIEQEPDIDLDTPATSPMEFAKDWTKLVWMIESVDHTATHVGHAQIHRQLWLAERGNA